MTGFPGKARWTSAGCRSRQAAPEGVPLIVTLTGTLDAAGEPETVRDAVPEHIRLSRAEPGCLRFEVVAREDGFFEVSEAFADQAAFDAHQTRTRASAWWRATSHMPRDFEVTTSDE